MKKLVIIVLFVQIIFSQTEHWTNIYAGLEYQNYNLKYNPNYKPEKLFETNFGYCVGLNYKLVVNERIPINMAIEFNHFLPKSELTLAGPNIDSVNSFLKYNVYQIGLNLSGGYYFLNKEKYKIGFEAGFNFKYVAFEYAAHYTFTDGSPSFIDRGTANFVNGQASKWQIEPMITIPIHYLITDEYNVFISPYFGYGIVPIVSGQTPFYKYQMNSYRIGCKIGFELLF